MFTRARIVNVFQTGTDPEGTFVDLEDGNVNLHARGEVRSTADVTVLGEEFTNHPSGLVTPYGGELFIETGIEYGNGDREIVSMGYHRMTSAEATIVRRGANAGRDAIRVMASDRMQKIIAARLTAPRAFYPGHTVRQVFDSIVLQVYPDAVIEYDFDPDGVSLTAIMVAEENRYEFLRDVAAAFGKVCYFDYRGVLVVKSRPNPTVPLYEINEGKNGTLTGVNRTLSIEGVYNAVCARSQSTAEGEKPIQAVAYDNDPTSPTYYRGPNVYGKIFGKVPRFFSSSLLKNRQQCRDAAEAILRGAVGLPYLVDFGTVPNPALEPDDPVRVRAPDKSEIHILDDLAIPLTVSDSAMQATAREQTNMIVGFEDGELS